MTFSSCPTSLTARKKRGPVPISWAVKSRDPWNLGDRRSIRRRLPTWSALPYGTRRTINRCWKQVTRTTNDDARPGTTGHYRRNPEEAFSGDSGKSRKAVSRDRERFYGKSCRSLQAHHPGDRFSPSSEPCHRGGERLTCACHPQHHTDRLRSLQRRTA